MNSNSFHFIQTIFPAKAAIATRTTAVISTTRKSSCLTWKIESKKKSETAKGKTNKLQVKAIHIHFLCMLFTGYLFVNAAPLRGAAELNLGVYYPAAKNTPI